MPHALPFVYLLGVTCLSLWSWQLGPRKSHYLGLNSILWPLNVLPFTSLKHHFLWQGNFFQWEAIKWVFGPHFNLVRTTGQNSKCWLMFCTHTYPPFPLLRSPSQAPGHREDPMTPRYAGFWRCGYYRATCWSRPSGLCWGCIWALATALSWDPSMLSTSSLPTPQLFSGRDICRVPTSKR